MRKIRIRTNGAEYFIDVTWNGEWQQRCREFSLEDAITAYVKIKSEIQDQWITVIEEEIG